MLRTRRLFISSYLYRAFTTYSRPHIPVMDRYKDLTREELVARLAALETPQASSSNLETREPTAYELRKAKKAEKRLEKFDTTKYPCRKIALRFSYDGSSYSGLATQKSTHGSGPVSDEVDSVETVEDTLWKALSATRLVGEDQSFGDVGWSRCGRTDRGVSAGGQVIALWVRSRKVDQWDERRALEQFVAERKREQGIQDEDNNVLELVKEHLEQVTSASHNGHVSDDSAPDKGTRLKAEPDSEELAYVSTLNNVLPPTIRIQAWSPVRPHFSARFDCRFRHYKYFFTSGCSFTKQSSSRGPVPQLDVPLMRRTAQKFLGDHDFRNFCKVDPSKQVENHRRRIDGISINRISEPWPVSAEQQTQNNTADPEMATNNESMYVLNLRGTAFLYHQVRHMVAVLFLVGAKLEKPSIVDELLNVEKGGVARDRLLMRRRGLVLDDDNLQTTLPQSTATTMTGFVASDLATADIDVEVLPSPSQIDSKELNDGERDLLDLVVYDGKPEYQMASDRPLMLWECGFKESDVQWRSGTYDGPLPSPQTSSSSATKEDDAIKADINSSTSTSIALLHAQWSSLSITAELYKHFLLALPLDVGVDQAGYIPSSLFFDKSSKPSLHKASIPVLSHKSPSPHAPRSIVPLGDGQFKAVNGYKPLLHTKREETPEIKNARYSQTRGKRRAERKTASSNAVD